MEILRAETNEFPHLKNSDAPTNSSRASSTIDEDEDDRFSNVSVSDEKVSSTNKQHQQQATDTDEKPAKKSFDSSPIANPSIPTIDYTHHRERLAKELKDYEDRWLAHRNFLLYSQSFAMKPEDRERLFSQINLNEENSSLNQLQIQQQLFHRLSKEERDRFLAAAIYQHQQQQQQQQQPPPPPPPNPFNFHSYPWTNPPPTSLLSPTPNLLSQIQSSQDHQQPKSPSSDDSGNQSNSGSTTEWTFEEQFRQLYELSDEPKRKEFLDDLFAFMQKRGTPVNRIPIMAKHVLDLYELFRLVVSKGGLVEVINKKLWREVTKGLNLPSSITSAAFTLRTQYMKYLYPYECEKLQLSSPGELQAAIEGNRREGRRPSYAFEYSSPPQIMPPPPPPPPSSSAATSYLASPLAHRPLDSNHAAMAAAAALSHPFFLAAAAAASSSSVARDVNEISSSSSSSSTAAAAATTTTTTRISSFDDHHHLTSSSTLKRSLSPSFLSKTTDDMNKKFASTIANNQLTRTNSFTPPATTNSPLLLSSQVSKLKIITKENNCEQQINEKSINLSFELNGIAYQGTLYATTNTGSKD